MVCDIKLLLQDPQLRLHPGTICLVSDDGEQIFASSLRAAGERGWRTVLVSKNGSTRLMQGAAHQSLGWANCNARARAVSPCRVLVFIVVTLIHSLMICVKLGFEITGHFPKSRDVFVSQPSTQFQMHVFAGTDLNFVSVAAQDKGLHARTVEPPKARKLEAPPSEAPLVTIRASSEHLGVDFAMTIPATKQRESFSLLLFDLASAINSGQVLDMRQEDGMKSFEARLSRNLWNRDAQQRYYTELAKDRPNGVYEQQAMKMHEMRLSYYRELDHLRDQLGIKMQEYRPPIQTRRRQKNALAAQMLQKMGCLRSRICLWCVSADGRRRRSPWNRIG
eukprot:s1577_g2.t1